MSTNTPSVSQLKRAISIAEQIQKLQEELASLVGGSAPSAVSSPKASPAPKAPNGRRGGRRTMSPEARARIAEAQRARWAKVNSGKNSASQASATPKAVEAKATASKSASKGKGKGKRTVSPEARAKMAEAARRRWAAKGK